MIPVIHKEDDQKALVAKLEELQTALKKVGIRTYIDDRENYKPGWKYNHWELKGVPMRFELGKKDFEKGEVRCCRRDTGEKF